MMVQRSLSATRVHIPEIGPDGAISRPEFSESKPRKFRQDLRFFLEVLGTILPELPSGKAARKIPKSKVAIADCS